MCGQDTCLPCSIVARDKLLAPPGSPMRTSPDTGARTAKRITNPLQDSILPHVRTFALSRSCPAFGRWSLTAPGHVLRTRLRPEKSAEALVRRSPQSVGVGLRATSRLRITQQLLIDVESLLHFPTMCSGSLLFSLHTYSPTSSLVSRSAARLMIHGFA